MRKACRAPVEEGGLKALDLGLIPRSKYLISFIVGNCLNLLSLFLSVNGKSDAYFVQLF